MMMTINTLIYYQTVDKRKRVDDVDVDVEENNSIQF